MKKVSIAIIFIAITALSFLAGGWYGKDQADGSSSRTGRKVLYYIDPMIPGFRSDKPGVAPCGMPLEPVYAEAGGAQQATVIGAPPQSPGAVKISPARQQLIGVHVDPVALEPMTYTLRLYGRIVTDETKTYRINASTDSWIRVLSDITTGSIVSKDQILAEALAPAFYNAQVVYLLALDNVDRIREQFGGQLRHQQADIADNQIRVSVQSLQNLGITDAQVEELANTRKAQPLLQVRSPVDGVVLSRNLTLYQWFKAGEEFYSIADIGKVWVYVDVYEDETRHLRPGMDVQVMHLQMGKTFDARVSQVLPLFDPVAKTLKVRLDVDNPRYDLRPDMFVDVEIPITMPPSLHVPADAVIDSGTRKVVYVDVGNGVFEPRRVETGWRLGRQIEITGGLMPGEKVIVSGNFLIDSESRMKTAAAGIYSATRKDPVCGMYVDEEKSRMSGKIAEYGDETLYFCAVRCRETFKKDPVKYARKVLKSGKEEERAAMAGKDHDWLDMLESAKDKTVEDGGAHPKRAMKDSIGTPASFPGVPDVVDWDGPDQEGDGAPPRDWSGWGKFPGAEYLGLKDKAKKIPEYRPYISGAGRETPPEDEEDSPIDAPASMSHAHHSEMKDEMGELPASGEPTPPANR